MNINHVHWCNAFQDNETQMSPTLGTNYFRLEKFTGSHFLQYRIKIKSMENVKPGKPTVTIFSFSFSGYFKIVKIHRNMDVFNIYM